MKATVNLSETHRRVISVVMKIVESRLDEMYQVLNRPHQGTTYGIHQDLEADEINRSNFVIRRAKDLVKEISKKYGLRQEYRTQSAVIRAKKANLWSILEDSYSKKLRRYGELDARIATEFDCEIEKLIYLIESI